MTLLDEIEKSFPEMQKLFSKHELQQFKKTPSSDLYMYHFGLGTWIRNDLLNETGVLHQRFVEAGIPCKDMMSSIVLYRFHTFITRKG